MAPGAVMTALDEAALLVGEARRRGEPVPLELEQELCVREALRRGINPWPTFRSYVEYQNPTLLAFEHIEKLIVAAEMLVSRQIVNLLVLLPPRYLKTETFAKLLGSYAMVRNPYRSTGLSSYNASKAREVSVGAREYFEQAGGVLKPGQDAKGFWGPQQGGTFWAVGVAEGTLGRGMHLGICDDPIDPDKSRSSAYQHRFMNWWPEKWLSRREPGADSQLVFVMQRLGMEDPVGYLFRREVGENTEAAPLNWHVLVCDEIKSDEPLGKWSGPQGLPPTCTLLPDTRAIGEVLSPSLVSKPEVLRIHREMASTTASAQRQQRPMRATGDFWHKRWFELHIYDTLPPGAHDGGKDWDTAYSSDEANAGCAWVESYRGPDRPDDTFDVYIEACGWDWLEFPALVKLMQSIPGPHYVEAKASGKSVVQALKVYGVTADEVSVEGDKLARASKAQPAVASGRVFIRRVCYDALLSGEGQGLLRVTAESLTAGTGGLDLNDAFVQALFRHLKLGAETKKKRSAAYA